MAGFTPVVVENVVEHDELRTDIAGVKDAIFRVGAENVLCVMSTTRCARGVLAQRGGRLRGHRLRARAVASRHEAWTKSRSWRACVKK